SRPARLDRIEAIKIIGLRRRIAERMQESKRRIPHYSYVEELDVTTLEELRAHLNARHGADRPRLTLLPFLIRALVCAIPRFPGERCPAARGSHRTHRWRKPDSNLYGAFPVKW